MGSMQLQKGASAAVEAMMAESRGWASRSVCRACRSAARCSRCRLSSSAFSFPSSAGKPLFNSCFITGCPDILLLSGRCNTQELIVRKEFIRMMVYTQADKRLNLLA